MLQYGKETGLPETYRITLAVSLALLIHTLLMATFPFALPEHNHSPITVQVQLTPEGSLASRQNAPSPDSPAVRATPFNIEDIQASPPTRTIPTTSSPQTRAVPKPPKEEASSPELQKTPEPRSTPPAQPPAHTSPSPSAPASTPSVTGEKSARQGDTEQPLTLRSEQPSEESSYLSLLAQTIGQKATIPKLEEFEEGQVLSVELELNLMSNGALMGARITGPSGNDGLDQRVYRAALAASPYPEPPPSDARQQRFRVKVRYTF